MDKREYQEKLQEINRLIAAEDYEGAARIADSIDWKRVRNVQTLVMISEVYEALERYEDSKALLLRAYRRSPVGRTVLYRLVECCIKLRQFDQAIEYYSEYVQAAPHDNNKYILKYKIYRGRGASLDEQIEILKEYLDQEYNEKWAYELARLQIQAGYTQEGLATCDDLVLWFHSGKYVIKALELKKKYAPLTPKQQEIYDNRFEDEEEPEIHPESYLSEAASLAKAERAAAAQEEIKSELAMDISHTAQMEATKVELSRKAEEAQAEVDRKAAQSREALSAKKIEDEEDAQSAVAEPTVVSAAGTMDIPAAETADYSAPETGDISAAETVAVVTAGAAAIAAASAGIPEAEAADVSAAEAADIPASETADISMPEMTGVSASEVADTPVPDSADILLSETAASKWTEAVAENEMEEPEAAADGTEGREESATLSGEPIGEPVSSSTVMPGLFTETGSASTESSEQITEAETASTKFSGLFTEPSKAVEPAGQEEGPEQESESASPEKLQEDMVRSMREIVSGVGPKDSLGADEAILEEAIEQSKEDQENAVAARGTDMTFRVPASEASQKRQAGRLTIDDILLSMGDGGDYVRKVTGANVMSATEEAQMNAQQQAASEIPHIMQDEVRQARRTAEIPAVEIAQADDALRAHMGIMGRDQAVAGPDGFAGNSQIAPAESGNDFAPSGEAGDFAASIPSPDGEVDTAAAADALADDGKESDPTAAAVAAAFMSTPRVEYTKEIAEAKTRRLPVDEIRKLHEAYLSENAAAAEEAAKNASQAAERAVEKARSEVEAEAGGFDGDVRIAGAPGADFGAASNETAPAGTTPADAAAYGTMPSGSAPSDTASYETESSGTAPSDAAVYGTVLTGAALAGAAAYGTASSEKEPEDAAVYETAPSGMDQSGAASFGDTPAGESGVSGVMPASEESYAKDAFARNGRIGEQVMREVPKSEPEPAIYTGRQQLKESQMELFSGFTSIRNLPEQIAAAIWQAENRRDDRTSRSGNILILGAHGCGKTTIATGIAKAIAEDKGTHSVKMARIYAADLNRKDIAATIAKIAGGVLIVEEAGDLDDGIVDQLTTAMEFRTDGMIMILEDEQRYIHDLLMRHPRFTMKFTAQIYIPEYTGEDLVNFAQIYANGKDYVLSEGAVEACRSRIEAAKKNGEAVSVTNVIELVDRAMKSANTFFRRIGSAKKRYDSEDRIILQEKDFR